MNLDSIGNSLFYQLLLSSLEKYSFRKKNSTLYLFIFQITQLETWLVQVCCVTIFSTNHRPPFHKLWLAPLGNWHLTLGCYWVRVTFIYWYIPNFNFQSCDSLLNIRIFIKSFKHGRKNSRNYNLHPEYRRFLGFGGTIEEKFCQWIFCRTSQNS